MPKQDCKYWDKCYQRNEQHLQKYNHPAKVEDVANSEDAEKHDASAAVEDAATKTSIDDEQKHEVPAKVEEVGTNSKASNANSAQPEPQHDAAKRKTADDDTNADSAAQGATSQEQRQEIDTTELADEVLFNIFDKNYLEQLHKRLKLSMQTEYDDLLRTNEFIRHKFLVEMPTEFYEFWKFVSNLKKDMTGVQLLKYFEDQFQLLLVGPFEFLAGRFHNANMKEPGDYLRHWRFFYDPAEFQTLFVRKNTGIHYGYWRDTPQDKSDLLIARNDALNNCEFEFIAGNAFDALLYYLQKDFVGTPFTTSLVANTKKELQNYLAANELPIKNLAELKKARNAKVVTKTFHRAGIVVPFDHTTKVGYRPLIVSDKELKKIVGLFEKVGRDERQTIKKVVTEKLQPIATAASIAVDECDFGTALELGVDLFSSGRIELHGFILTLLVPAYTLLNRPQFIAISKAHMDRRSLDIQLSMFSLD